jgi:hypothetical protein
MGRLKCRQGPLAVGCPGVSEGWLMVWGHASNNYRLNKSGKAQFLKKSIVRNEKCVVIVKSTRT